MKFLKESGLILLAFIIVYIWQQTFLSQYTIHALVGLTLLYLLLTARPLRPPRLGEAGRSSSEARKKEFSLLRQTGDSSSVFIITLMVFLLVVSTGGLTSTLFFLLYFLCFGITFAFEPVTVFVFVVLATVWFLQSALSDDVVSNFLHIGSLYLVAPIAFFFGRQIKNEQSEQKALQKKTKKTKRVRK